MDSQESETQARERTTWDVIAQELQALRERAGNPSYAMIAQLVADHRMARGTPPAAARVAKSTVHDYFRLGRTRGSLPLVREIVTALGSDHKQVDAWLTRLHEPEEPRAEVDSFRVTTSQPAAASGDPAPVAAGLRQACILMVMCLALNMTGRFLVDSLHLPGYLDMVGTAVAAVALGPWHGALVGAATNVLGVASSGTASLYFAPVNVLGALVWGYGVHRFGMGRTLQRFFLLSVATGLLCTALAVPILYLVFGGFNGNGTDFITATVEGMTGSRLAGILTSNTLVSQADKLVSSFIALVAVASLPCAYRRAAPLIVMTTPQASPTTSSASQA